MGFGSSRFGTGPFGRVDWAQAVLHDLLPTRLRQEDEQAQGLFLALLSTFKTSLDPLRQRILDLPLVRSPLQVASQYTTTKAVTVTATTVVDAVAGGDWGAHVQLTCTLPPVDIGPGWRTLFDGVEYEVLRVRKQELRVDLVGTQDPGPGSFTFWAPEQLSSLAADYGVPLDRYLSDTFLRAEVEHAIQWLGLKGAQPGYQQRGKVAGFDVLVLALWVIDPAWTGYLETWEWFEYPAGSGQLLTYIAPQFVLLDDVTDGYVPADLWWPTRPAGTLEYVRTAAVTSPALPWTQATVHQVSFGPVGQLPAIGQLGHWWFRDAAGTDWALETHLADVPNALYAVVGLQAPAPGVGLVYYTPPERAVPGVWNKSHFVRVEITPDPAALATWPVDPGAFTARMILKLRQVKPAHVEFAQIVESYTTTTTVTTEVTDSSLELTNYPLPAGAFPMDVIPDGALTPDTTGQVQVTDTYTP